MVEIEQEARLRQWWDYFVLCFRYAKKGLWPFFKDKFFWGLVQTIVTFIVIALLAQPSFPGGFWKNLIEAGIAGNIYAIIMAIVITIIFMFILRWLFIAPYKLYQLEKEAKEKLQTEWDEWKDGMLKKAIEDSDLAPLYTAIDYIQKQTQFGKRMTCEEVFDELKRLSIGSAIEIRGREKAAYSQTANNYNSVVNLQGHSSCNYENYGDFGTPALIVVKSQKPLWENDPNNILNNPLGERTSTTIYYDPIVSMSEIKRHFDDKE